MATPLPENQAHFTLSELEHATGGSFVRRGAQDGGTGIVIDNRLVKSGNIFVAIVGESHDGHAFASRAAASGAAVLVVARGRASTLPRAQIGDASVLEVDDTLVALGALARAHLEKWRRADARRAVLAITGSAGKTTTKELSSALLSKVGPTHATAGNLNNRVGVPFVVLALTPHHRYAVLEMGMSLPGELDAITAIARPDASIITNVGLAHSEGVSGIDGVAHEKGAVYRALLSSGAAIVNADDERVVRAALASKAERRVTFGVAATADVRLVGRTSLASFGSRVEIQAHGRNLVIELPIPGEVAALDLSAAIAAQEALTGERLSEAQFNEALASVRLAGRATLVPLGGGVTLLDDTYNANPASMRSALATLAEIAGPRRRVCVLGEMKELGAHAEPEHVALGDAVFQAGVSLAIGCGGLISKTLSRAAELGVEVISCASTEDAAREAKDRVRPSDVVLVKGSRGVGAEKVVAALKEGWPSAEKSAGISTP